MDLRSEEVNEILSKLPNWMLRFGSIAIFIVLIFLLLISWLIKYPDLIETESIITTEIPPQKMFTNASGKIDSIFVKDSQNVNKGSILAVLENTAITEDVFYLNSILDTLEIEEGAMDFSLHRIRPLVLGDINKSYASFENNYLQYVLSNKLKPFSNEAIANQKALMETKSRLNDLESQYLLKRQEFDIQCKNKGRYQQLLDKGVVSENDFDLVEIQTLTSERELKNLKVSISLTRETIAQVKKASNFTEISGILENRKKLTSVIQSLKELRKVIKDWEYKYVLRSDVVGKVNFLNYWNTNQSVSRGDLIFTVIPNVTSRYIAKLKASAKNSGKIMVNQLVNIKLENYPVQEFGILQGKVEAISGMPDSEGFFLINVSLPKTLTTSYNKPISFKHEMTGSAEIITEDLRLLERFLYRFRKLIKI